jgi:hypothetical protein
MIHKFQARQWFRFGLRTFLAVTILFCFWLGSKVLAARNQRDAVAAIKSLGGEVLYDYEVGPDIINPYSPRPDPEWASRLFGVDLFHDVADVDVHGRDGGRLDLREVLPRLPHLPRLRSLILMGGDIRDEDFTFLENLHDVERLWLSSTQMKGVGFDRLDCPKLRWITVTDSPISDEGLRAISRFRHLQALRIENARISDAGVQYLRGCPDLKLLNLQGTNITNESIELLTGFESLKFLDVGGTNVSESAAVRLRQMKPNAMIWDTKVRPTIREINRMYSQ